MRADKSCVRSRIKPSGQLLVKQRKKNKFSTTFWDTPYDIASKCCNNVTVTSPEAVTYKINVTEVKRYLKASDEPDPQFTERSITDGTADAEVQSYP